MATVLDARPLRPLWLPVGASDEEGLALEQHYGITVAGPSYRLVPDVVDWLATRLDWGVAGSTILAYGLPTGTARGRRLAALAVIVEPVGADTPAQQSSAVQGPSTVTLSASMVVGQDSRNLSTALERMAEVDTAVASMTGEIG